MSTGSPWSDFDPGPFLRGLAALRRLTVMYPTGHPVIAQKVDELFQNIAPGLASRGTMNIDIIHDELHVEGAPCHSDVSSVQAIRELAEVGAHSFQLRPGLQADELRRVAEFLTRAADDDRRPIGERLAECGISHISFGRIVPLDTRWRAPQWGDGPPPPMDPSYAEALSRAEQAFDTAAAGHALNAIDIRELVQLLIGKVARSNAALAQILTLKNYENLTYCHSVNVAILSLMLGEQLRLDEGMLTILVEAALLHDIGKTRVPLDIVQKPGALDKAERTIIEAHTTFGAEILVDTDGVHPLAPTVALEHHRGVNGTGYPNLGDGVIPHAMSQIVSVADIYEALTGARSYREPMKPAQACLVLAREAGTKLNTSFVKAFVSAVTFFPVGSLVRTNRDEIGIVLRTNSKDPLHPLISVTNDTFDEVFGEVDTSERDADGQYLRQIVQTIGGRPNVPFVASLIATAP
jgi:putative nucleotidyltransferase with HDIG domain